jgi:hypothetical protein
MKGDCAVRLNSVSFKMSTIDYCSWLLTLMGLCFAVLAQAQSTADASTLPFSTASVASSGPLITSVSPILPQPNQTITISGTGFGTQQPYSGDSLYIRITDVTSQWNAGFTGDSPADFVTLGIASWADALISRIRGGLRRGQLDAQLGR